MLMLLVQCSNVMRCVLAAQEACWICDWFVRHRTQNRSCSHRLQSSYLRRTCHVSRDFTLN